MAAPNMMSPKSDHDLTMKSPVWFSHRIRPKKSELGKNVAAGLQHLPRGREAQPEAQSYSTFTAATGSAVSQAVSLFSIQGLSCSASETHSPLLSCKPGLLHLIHIVAAVKDTQTETLKCKKPNLPLGSLLVIHKMRRPCGQMSKRPSDHFSGTCCKV